MLFAIYEQSIAHYSYHQDAGGRVYATRKSAEERKKVTEATAGSKPLTLTPSTLTVTPTTDDVAAAFKLSDSYDLSEFAALSLVQQARANISASRIISALQVSRVLAVVVVVVDAVAVAVMAVVLS